MRWIVLLCVAGGLAGVAYWGLSTGPSEEAVQVSRTESEREPAAESDLQVPRASDQDPGRALEADSDDANRHSISRPVYRRAVLDDNGSPLAGALVSWTAVSEESVQSFLWQSADEGGWQGRTLWAHVDAAGWFTFEQTPPGSGVSGSVLWVTHPDYLATFAVLPADDPLDSGEPLLTSVVSRRTVRVVDASGKPESGASVFQYAHRLSAEGDEQALAQRHFFREVVTGEDGSADLVTIPGTESTFARAGEDLSEPLVQLSEGDVTHRLGASFSVLGSVQLTDGAPLEAGVEVLCQSYRDELWVDFASVNVRRDGRWGPVRVALGESQQFRFSAQGGGVVRVAEAMSAPLAGEEVRVDFRTVLGLDQWFRVEDEETEETLHEAKVVIHWQTEESTWDSIEVHPREDGYILARGIPPGSIWYDSSCAGYSRHRGGPDVLPAPEPHTFVTRLKRAAPVTGRCTSLDAPVSDFDVVYWPGSDIYQMATAEFRGREDGAFEIESVAVGELSLVAHAPGYGQSEVARVDVLEGGLGNLVLDLARAIDAHGRVLDQVTGQPVPGASLQLYVTDGIQALVPRGRPSITGSEGRFEVDGLSAVASTIRVSADGYSDEYVSGAAGASGVADIGVVALTPAKPLEIRLQLLNGEDPTQYSVRTDVVSLPSTLFSADASVFVEEFDAGTHTFIVEAPDDRTIYVPVMLDPKEDWVVDVPLDGGCRAHIEVDAEKEMLARGLWANVTWLGGHSRLEFERRLPDSGRVTIDGLSPGEFIVRIMHEGTTYATSSGDLSRGEEAQIELSLTSEPRLFRVVDLDGTPLPSTLVRFSIDGDDTEDLGGYSDSKGEFVCGAVEGQILTAFLRHPKAGTAPRVPVALTSDPSLVTLLILDASQSMTVRLLDRGAAAAGINCSLCARGSGREVDVSYASDDKGQVRWARLAAGEYDFETAHPDYWPIRRTLAAMDGKLHSIDLHRLADIVVRVQDARGLALPSVTVELESIEFNTPVREWLDAGLVSSSTTDLRTGQDGTLSVVGVPRGTYRWRLVHRGQVGTFEAAEDGAVQVTITASD